MAKITLAMLHDALDAFWHEDTAKAEAVMLRDDRVDALNASILRTWLTRTAAAPDPDRTGGTRSSSPAPSSASRIMRPASVRVFYLVEGADIRHQTP